MEIKNGTEFETRFAIGLKALETPDEEGMFLAIDWDGEEVYYSTRMVIGHQDFKEPSIPFHGLRMGECE